MAKMKQLNEFAQSRGYRTGSNLKRMKNLKQCERHAR